MRYWLRSANPLVFDHEGCFAKYGFVDYSQVEKRKIQEGDIVFLYRSNKTKKDKRKVLYKCFVEINTVSKNDRIDDNTFWKNAKEKQIAEGKSKDRYRLIGVAVFDSDQLIYENLEKYCAKNNIPFPKPTELNSPSELDKELVKYMDQFYRSPFHPIVLNKKVDEVDSDENIKFFKQWMRRHDYAESSIKSYPSDIIHHPVYLKKTLFSINDPKIVDMVLEMPDITDQRKSVVSSYKEYLEEKELCSESNVKYNTGYRVTDTKFVGNRIFFGAPGTGKSFTLNKQASVLLGEEFKETNSERVTFHPDYSYANFVGTYKPVPIKDNDGKESITYKYVPGPFMRLYVKALKNSRTSEPKPFLLIIEEINRANVAAVFGDVFQLLDRNDDNISEYPVQASEDIRQYLADELGGSPDDYPTLCIPDNLFIWATMNSADQGVFPMDTAFKRRWDFTYIGINNNSDEIKDKYVELADGTQTVVWDDLRIAINNFLSKNKINEDKQLGPYFLPPRVIAPPIGDDVDPNMIDPERFTESFKNKVLMYLFEDAGKRIQSRLFEGYTRYSEICEAFDTNGIKVFNKEIWEANNVMTENQTEE